MVITVAFLSDTHGTLDARVAMEVAKCDYAIHAGDIGRNTVLNALHPRRGLIAVRGNNDTPDKWPPDDRRVLESIPWEASLEVPGGTIVVVHGHRAGPPKVRHQRLRAMYPSARAVVYGHSHHLLCDLERVPWVINPGAAGYLRTYGGPSCMILVVRQRTWRIEVKRFTAQQGRPSERS
ncbi:MAG: metallophosphatase family protein [Gammaproteobacteria bacterium]|nr:metallophosphatase family protein [Gammaproteobacteria bacterium]MCI0591473.1 metallophosphatase family protein [Gammaproteobacteria bacterium]